MGTFHLKNLPKYKRIQMIAEFYDIIDSLKNRDEVRAFFKDLLTGDEIATLMRRIEVALLLESKFTYDQIAELLGVGRGKINNVQKILLKEGNGYRIIIKRLLEDRKRRLNKYKRIEKAGTSEFENLKRRYPGPFLLFNLIDAVSESLEDKSEIEKEALLFTPSLVSFGDKRIKRADDKSNKDKDNNKKQHQD